MRKEFLPYLKLIDFLGGVLGKNTEVVLHDTTDLNNSIIAIRNGNVSGRSVGGPATDLVLRILRDPELNKKDYLCNYTGYAKGGTPLRSSTFFIRDESGEITGMICINSDYHDLLSAREILNSLIPPQEEDTRASDSGMIFERLSQNVDELTLDSIQRVISEAGIPPERMSAQEKINIVVELFEMGLFHLKGAVSKVADTLKISEPTVYRYLNQIKKSGGRGENISQSED